MEGSQTEVADALRFWYRHPDWQAMLLCPWLRVEETFRLADVYTRLEMESVVSRQVKSLKAYTELFHNLHTEKGETGYRIMVQGHPGIGKTTFTHKIALDWALDHWTLFQVVFVIQLRDLKPTESIPHAILEQMKTPDGVHLTEGTINRHLLDPENSVLLILDGLDEIELTQFPQVHKVLSGEEYSACCVLVTSRPHVSPAVKNEMNCIAKITGFTQRSAEEYVSHIIADPDIRKHFFKEITERKMKGMASIPIILQALALLFSADSCLPDTYTLTYDELVLYLQKTCEAIQGLSRERILAAQTVASELAFRGLTDATQQRLIFSREEISNEDVFRLGILSATKTVTGFRPTSTVQFPHKTIQEYAASNHVAQRLIAGDTGPWETIQTMYRNLFKKNQGDKETTPAGRRKPRQLRPQMTSADSSEDNKALVINSAFQKTMKSIKQTEGGTDAGVTALLQFILRQGFLDAEPDPTHLWQVFRTYPATQDFTEEEFEVSFEFILNHLVGPLHPEQKEEFKKLLPSFEPQNNGIYMTMMSVLMNQNPQGSIAILTNVVEKSFRPGDAITVQSIIQQREGPREQADSMKILFRFLMGKLQGHPDLANQILGDIAEMLLAHAMDPESGDVLSVSFLKSYITDLMAEARIPLNNPTHALYSSDTCLSHDDIPIPALVHIKGPIPGINLQPSGVGPNALKLEDISGSLESVMILMKNMNDLTIVEMQNIPGSVLEVQECRKLGETLDSLGTVQSLFLSRVKDVTLTNGVLQNLPKSAKKLALYSLPSSTTYQFPDQINLRSLYLESTLSGGGLCQMFQSTYSHLATLLIVSRFRWSQQDVESLHQAVTKGRMPALTHICIRFGDLSGYGSQLVDILKKRNLQTVDLMDTGLTLNDGKILLTAIKSGNLNNLQSLNVLQNPGISTLKPELSVACEERQIEVQCTPPSTSPSIPWWFWAAESLHSWWSRCTIL